MRHYFTFIRIAITLKNKIKKETAVGVDMKTLEHLCIASGNVK